MHQLFVVDLVLHFHSLQTSFLFFADLLGLKVVSIDLLLAVHESRSLLLIFLSVVFTLA